YCSLDLHGEIGEQSLLREVEARVNALATENRAISVSFEDSRTARGLRKPSEREGMLRIITIDGLDRNACGGTHVSQTGEIGPLLLRRTARTRGGTRLEFLCGARAIHGARTDYEIVQQTAMSFSAALDDVPDLVNSL